MMVPLINLSGGGSISPTPELNNIQNWLLLGKVSGSYYALADILADTTALSKLMSTQASINYMANSTDWINDITASSNAMYYIGINNSCADRVLSDSNWITKLCTSVYSDYVVNKKVPTMTSNTTPSGTAIRDTCASSTYEAYKAFDNNDTTYWATNDTSAGHWLGYTFPSSTRIVAVGCKTGNPSGSYYVNSFIVQGSLNASTYTNLSETLTVVPSDNFKIFKVDTNTQYPTYRILIQSFHTYAYLATLQFYCRDNVS